MIVNKNDIGAVLDTALLCLDMYVNHKWSYRKIGKNLLISHQSVKNYLDKLQYYDDELYQLYDNERKRKNETKRRN